MTTFRQQPLRVLITGSRDFIDTPVNAELMYQALSVPLHPVVDTHGTFIRPAWSPEHVTIVHGGARGADQLAGRIARELGFVEEVHPAQWEVHGRKAGPIRNQYMVELGATCCLAFPVGLSQGRSRGTAHAMAAARRAGIPVHQITD